MKMNIVVLLTFIALCGFSWSSSFKDDTVVYSHDEYETYLNEAKNQYDLGVYVRAEQYYTSALALNDGDIEVHYMYAQTLLDQSYNANYYAKLSDIMHRFPDDERAYDLLVDIYYNQKRYRDVIDVIIFAQENSMVSKISDETKQLYYKSVYQYSEKGSYDEVVSFWENIAMVRTNGLWGYITESGALIAPKYEDASPFSSGLAAVLDNGEYYFINSKGQKYIATREDYDKILMYGESRIVVIKDGKYGYADVKLNPLKIEWDYAGTFKNSVAAVKKGDKWGLINTDFEYIVEPVYDDVKLNEVGICINQGIIIVKQNGKYFMIDAAGAILNEKKFDDMKQFADGAYAAVCIDGKWGFADISGEIKIEPIYENADSFAAGLAPVCIDGKWGYIDANSRVAVEPAFDEARCFNNRGIAAVKAENKWKFIQLLLYTSK